MGDPPVDQLFKKLETHEQRLGAQFSRLNSPVIKIRSSCSWTSAKRTRQNAAECSPYGSGYTASIQIGVKRPAPHDDFVNSSLSLQSMVPQLKPFLMR